MTDETNTAEADAADDVTGELMEAFGRFALENAMGDIARLVGAVEGKGLTADEVVAAVAAMKAERDRLREGIEETAARLHADADRDWDGLSVRASVKRSVANELGRIVNP